MGLFCLVGDCCDYFGLWWYVGVFYGVGLDCIGIIDIDVDIVVCDGVEYYC